MTREDRSNIAGLIKRVGFVVLAVALVAINPPRLAQATARDEPSAPIDLAVPTTKLLAMGSFTAKATPNLWAPILLRGARAVSRWENRPVVRQAGPERGRVYSERHRPEGDA